MYGPARLVLAAATAALMVAAAGCGGYGVNLRGSSSANANQVAIAAPSGPTLNPYPLLVQHTVVFVAHPSAGNVVNYQVDEPVIWDSNNATQVVLLEPSCNAPYGGEYTTTICVFANTFGKAVGNVNATTTNGAKGTIVVSITN